MGDVRLRVGTLGMLLALLLLGGCGMLRDVPLPALLGSPTPPVLPTPVGDTLRFVVPRPAYRVTLTAGERVPGTAMGLIGVNGDTFTVEIDNQLASKRAGDSFFWRGVVAPAVLGQYNLFIERSFQPNALSAAGELQLIVFSPTPVEGAPPPGGAEVLVFDQIVTDHVVPLGGQIPGTSLVFAGLDGTTVTFSGTAFYPVRIIGDSLTWSGTLRPNVYVDHAMSLVSVDSVGLRVRGSATLRVSRTLQP